MKMKHMITCVAAALVLSASLYACAPSNPGTPSSAASTGNTSSKAISEEDLTLLETVSDDLFGEVPDGTRTFVKREAGAKIEDQECMVYTVNQAASSSSSSASTEVKALLAVSPDKEVYVDRKADGQHWRYVVVNTTAKIGDTVPGFQDDGISDVSSTPDDSSNGKALTQSVALGKFGFSMSIPGDASQSSEGGNIIMKMDGYRMYVSLMGKESKELGTTERNAIEEKIRSSLPEYDDIQTMGWDGSTSEISIGAGKYQLYQRAFSAATETNETRQGVAYYGVNGEWQIEILTIAKGKMTDDMQKQIMDILNTISMD